MNTNKAPFRIAAIEANKSKSPIKVACVLAKGERIISSGINNMDKSNPRSVRNGLRLCLHAEMAACSGLRPYDVKGANAYVCRIKKDGTLGMARPCAMCRTVLAQMGVNKVYYTTDTGWRMEKI